MGKKGPVSFGAKRTRGEILTLGGDYFPAPEDINAVAREVWKSTVSSLPANHFREADRPQLRAYCVAAAKNAKATAELDKEGEVLRSASDGKLYESPWSKIQDKTAQVISSLATKLRITQSSMLSAKGARREWDIARPAADKNNFDDLLFGGDEVRQ